MLDYILILDLEFASSKESLTKVNLNKMALSELMFKYTKYHTIAVGMHAFKKMTITENMARGTSERYGQCPKRVTHQTYRVPSTSLQLQIKQQNTISYIKQGQETCKQGAASENMACKGSNLDQKQTKTDKIMTRE